VNFGFLFSWLYASAAPWFYAAKSKSNPLVITDVAANLQWLADPIKSNSQPLPE
jgi:hypothetical protein